MLIVSLSLSLYCMYNQTVCDLCTRTPTCTLVLCFCLDRQTSSKLVANPAFNDPAIMSARFASPVLVPAMPEGYHNSASTISPSQVAYGPPPGLTYPPGISPSPVPSASQSQTNGSVLGESFLFHIRGDGVPGQSTSTERRAFSVRKIHYRP